MKEKARRLYTAKRKQMLSGTAPEKGRTKGERFWHFIMDYYITHLMYRISHSAASSGRKWNLKKAQV